MSKDFVPLQRHPAELPAEELQAALEGRADSVVMRSLLVAEVKAIRAGEERESRTLRSLWYSLVKPALSRAGLLNAETKGGKPVDWAAKLSVYTAELVRAGFTSYEELAIIDGSRQRQPAVAITQTVADVQLVGPHYPWLILFTEKDTIWGELQALAALYGVSAISGGGEPSNACTENTVKAILGAKAYTPGQPLTLLTLTDFDPAGYTIARAQFRQIQEAAPEAYVYHHRLGLTPDQLTPAELEANAYEPKDQGLEAWLQETGGLGGRPLGLELDALPISRLRSMFAAGIEQYIDLGPRWADLRLAFVDLLACELLSPQFNDKRAALREVVESSPLGEAIRGAQLPAGLFRWAAEQGLDCIDPVATGLFDCAGEVRRLMAETLGAV